MQVALVTSKNRTSYTDVQSLVALLNTFLTSHFAPGIFDQALSILAAFSQFADFFVLLFRYHRLVTIPV